MYLFKDESGNVRLSRALSLSRNLWPARGIRAHTIMLLTLFRSCALIFHIRNWEIVVYIAKDAGNFTLNSNVLICYLQIWSPRRCRAAASAAVSSVAIHYFSQNIRGSKVTIEFQAFSRYWDKDLMSQMMSPPLHITKLLLESVLFSPHALSSPLSTHYALSSKCTVLT